MTGPDGEEPITDMQYMEWAYAIDPKANPPPEEPEIPDYGERLWFAFWKLNSRRGPGFESPAALSYTEMQSWATLTRQRLSPDDVEVLTQMDDAYLRAVHEGQQRRREREERRNQRKQK